MSLLAVLFINGALLPAMNFFLQGNNLSRVFQKISKTFPTLLLIRTCDNTSKKVSLKILLKNIYFLERTILGSSLEKKAFII